MTIGRHAARLAAIGIGLATATAANATATVFIDASRPTTVTVAGFQRYAYEQPGRPVVSSRVTFNGASFAVDQGTYSFDPSSFRSVSFFTETIANCYCGSQLNVPTGFYFRRDGVIRGYFYYGFMQASFAEAAFRAGITYYDAQNPAPGTLVNGAQIIDASGDFVVPVDPKYDYAITVRFSPVTADAGAVPEPASWAMMIVGFGLVGGTLRRRRAAPAAAVA